MTKIRVTTKPQTNDGLMEEPVTRTTTAQHTTTPRKDNRLGLPWRIEWEKVKSDAGNMGPNNSM